jgi:hypothetical protein
MIYFYMSSSFRPVPTNFPACLSASSPGIYNSFRRKLLLPSEISRKRYMREQHRDLHGGEPKILQRPLGRRPSEDTSARENILALEPFVCAEEAAEFLSITRRHLLTLARRGIAGAYAIGTGRERRVWVFRLSELAGAVKGLNQPAESRGYGTIRSGSLRAERKA